MATELLFARDALRIAIATERSGLDFYSRAARVASDSRARRVFKRLAAEEEEHLGKLEVRYRAALGTGFRAGVTTDVSLLPRAPRMVCSPWEQTSSPTAWTTRRL